MTIGTRKVAEKKTPAPPPGPAPTSAATNPVSDLLASIRQGTSLKKVDQDKKETSKKRWGAAVGMFASLQDTLMGAMEERRTAMDEDSDDDDEIEDGWSDEEEWAD
uniref:WH2 domain-containing protein n=2 Tax=Paramoeba aestuarina TaxID=180227 RepID=A0A7S4P6A2_9EUKA